MSDEPRAPGSTPERPIEHWCSVCGAIAQWGYRVNIRAGQLGEWRCFEHRKQQPNNPTTSTEGRRP